MIEYDSIRELTGRQRTFAEIIAGDLCFDYDHYQRSPNGHKLTRISRWLNEDWLGVILVSRRADGSLWVMDGQHRVLAVIRRFGPERLVRCDVYDGLTVDEEALIFAKINSERGPVPTLLRYRAMLEGRDPEVVAIAEVLDEFHIEYPFAGGKTGRLVYCWAAMHDLLRLQGVDHLRTVLQFIDDCWNCSWHSVEMQMVKGVSLLLLHHSEDSGWHRRSAVDRFRRYPAEAIIQKAKKYKESGMNTQQAVYRALHAVYNHQRREENKLDDIRSRPPKPK